MGPGLTEEEKQACSMERSYIVVTNCIGVSFIRIGWSFGSTCHLSEGFIDFVLEKVMEDSKGVCEDLYGLST